MYTKYDYTYTTGYNVFSQVSKKTRGAFGNYTLNQCTTKLSYTNSIGNL